MLAGCTDSTEDPILTLETRFQEASGTEAWQTQHQVSELKPQETAILITDMWDQHWCDGATKRVAEMAPRMNHLIESARAQGITIIHSPSSVMEFYSEHPARKRVTALPLVTPPEPFKDWYDLDRDKESALPIDDSDGGCDTCPDGQPCDNVNESVWTRQIETIHIADDDAISDDGQEIYNVIHHHNIKNVVIMGVHANMCVLGRPFGIRAQRSMEMNVFLVRDLTDAMYNPEMPPYVTHDEGTGLVVDHIEKYWAPTLSSEDFLKSLNTN